VRHLDFLHVFRHGFLHCNPDRTPGLRCAFNPDLEGYICKDPAQVPLFKP